MQADTEIAYVNGDLLPLSEARVSILDRGFQFADGVYEVIPVYAGTPFRLEAHLARLERSLAEIGLALPMSREAFAANVEEVVRRNGGGDRQAYIQVTRGPAPRNHPFPDEVRPTVVMTSGPIAPVPGEWLEAGVGAVTAPDIRWARCDIKSIALLPNVMMRQRATEEGALEAIWIHGDQAVEGAASNLFAVSGGEALTPPDGPRVLPGITRDVVLEVAAEQDLPVRTGPVAETDLRSADELWLTSSTKEILPVTRLDGEPVGSGRPGPLFRRTLEAYRARIQAIREG